jgi:NADH-quinone oxidoreductase subunit L
VLGQLGESFHGSAAFLVHAFKGPAVYLAAFGALAAWFLYLKRPDIPGLLRDKASGFYNVLDNKYFFDDLWIKGFAAGGRKAGEFLYKKGDELVIDGMLVNGTANTVKRLAGVMRQLQTGYLYHYAFAMIIALTLYLGWMLWLS